MSAGTGYSPIRLYSCRVTYRTLASRGGDIFVLWWCRWSPTLSDQKKTTEQKWGADAVAAGFTIIPNHLISYNQFVPESEQLSPSEFFVLAQILRHWWGEQDKPFPSKASISARTGISPRQVQRILGQLESRGLIRRISRFSGSNAGRMSNAYDLRPLARKVADIAKKNPKLAIPRGEQSMLEED